jgi:hypothetical protein
MRRTPILAITLCAAAALFAAWAIWQPGEVHALTNCTTTEDGLNADELQMLSLINNARASAGVPALKPSPNLNRAAAWKSTDQTTKSTLSHTDSLGRLPSARASDCGYPGGAAENIAWGFPDVQATFNAWMSSSGHKANILNATYVGIGLGEHGSSWTTDFGFVDDSGSTAPPVTTAPPTNTARPTNTPLPTSTPLPTATPTEAAAPSGITMELAAGVNIVTYGGPRQPVATALTSIRWSVIEVYAWDSSAGSWQRYTPSGPGYVNSFTSFEPGRVYYLRMSSAATWSY